MRYDSKEIQTMPFEPELGQAMFSNTPWRPHETPWYVETGIDALATIIATIRLDADLLSANAGAEPFDNSTFQMRAYCWCDGDEPGHKEGCPPNFKCGDFEANWYKHSGRGASCNQDLDPEQWRELFLRCVRSLSAHW